MILQIVMRALSAWPMVAKRSLANWRLLSSVVIGVLLASAIMAGTVIYFDSLRDLALESALERYDPTDLHILTKTTKGPTTPEEYAGVQQVLETAYADRLGWLTEGVVRGGRSATFFMSPAGMEEQAGSDNSRCYFLFIDGIESKIELLPDGRMPKPPVIDLATARMQGASPVIVEAIIADSVSKELGLGIGDSMSAIPHWSDTVSHVTVVITGLYRRADPDDPMWRMNDEIFHTFSQGSFRTAPFLVSEDTLLRGVGSVFSNMDSSYGWMLLVDRERLRAVNATDARRSIVGIRSRLGGVLTSYRQVTELDSALADYDERLLFTRLQMFVVLILIAVVVLYYVITLSSLVAEQRRSEITLLRGRGATERQILAVFVLEGGTIAILAIVVAPFLAALAVGLLGYTPAFSDLSGGSALPVNLTRGAFIMSALGGALSFGALMVPAFEAARSNFSQGRQIAARPSRLSFFQRYYLDVMLLIVSLVLFRQLTDRGSVAAENLFGEVAANQLLLAVPAITLVASAMILLRLFPFVMSLASRMLQPRLAPGLVLGLWQMARNPTHYARLALLLILMTGLGIFAASFGGTLQRSFTERVLYDAGADIRLSGVSLNNSGRTRDLAESYENIDGVRSAAPALRMTGLVGGLRRGDSSFDALAVDTRRFGDAAWFREDFASSSLPEILSSIRVESVPLGIPLPSNTRAVEVLLKSDRSLPTVGVAARLRDANGRYFTYGLGFLESNSWQLYSADMLEGYNSRFSLSPRRPLTLVSIILGETNFESDLSSGSISIDSIHARLSTRQTVVLEDFQDIDGWNALRETPSAKRDRVRHSDVSSRGDGSLMFAWTDGPALAARGIFPGPPPEPIPVAASSSFARQFGVDVGDEVDVSFAGRPMKVILVDTVEFFPTLDSYRDRFLLADLDAVRARANLGTARGEMTPNEVWLTTDDPTGEARAPLLERFDDDKPFPVTKVIDSEANLELAQADPLVLAGWRALLLIAFGTILILSSLGFLVHAYISFRNRELQFALMRTMGFSTRQLVSLMWMEQALVIAVGMALGTWMGGRLGATIMPFLGHDDRGGQVLPPFVIEVGWQNLIVTYAAMLFIFAVIILGVIWFIQRMSLSRVLRLGDE